MSGALALLVDGKFRYHKVYTILIQNLMRWLLVAVDSLKRTSQTSSTFRSFPQYTSAVGRNHINLYSTLDHRGFGYRHPIAIRVPHRTPSSIGIRRRIKSKKTLTSSKSITDQDLSLHTKHGTLCASIRKVNIALETQSLVML